MPLTVVYGASLAAWRSRLTAASRMTSVLMNTKSATLLLRRWQGILPASVVLWWCLHFLDVTRPILSCGDFRNCLRLCVCMVLTFAGLLFKFATWNARIFLFWCSVGICVEEFKAILLHTFEGTLGWSNNLKMSPSPEGSEFVWIGYMAYYKGVLDEKKQLNYFLFVFFKLATSSVLPLLQAILKWCSQGLWDSRHYSSTEQSGFVCVLPREVLHVVQAHAATGVYHFTAMWPKGYEF